MTMGESIKALRDRRGLSQQALADVLSRTQQAVDSWEHDKAKPTADIIKKMADYFGVTPNDIYGIEIIDDSIESDDTEGVRILRRASKKMTQEQLKRASIILKASFDDFDWGDE